MKDAAGRLAYLDGLRGVAAFIVIIHHYILAVRPEFANGSIHYFGPGGRWPFAPVMGVWGGNLSVCVFFVLSGYVLARMYSETPSFLASQIVRRLIRLGVPITASMIIGILVWKSGSYANIELGHALGTTGWIDSFFVNKPSLSRSFSEIVAMPFVLRHSEANPVLWTMHMEYVGSFLIILFYYTIKPNLLKIISFIILFSYFYFTFMIDFLAGLFLWEILQSNALQSSKQRRLILILLVIPSLWFGLYPWSSGFGHLFFEFDHVANYFCFGDFQRAHCLGAIFIVAAVLLSPALQKLLSSAPIQFLGRTSFAVYLLHFLVICSLGAHLIIWLLTWMPQLAAEAITFPLVVIVSYGLASLFTRLIDVPATHLSQRAARAMDPWLEKLWNRYITGSVGRLWHRVRHGQAS